MKGFGEQRKSTQKKHSNPSTKSSKEKLITQAIKFHSEGNMQKASRYYQSCIDQNINDVRVFSNYGVILKKLGKLKEAEISYRRAIQLNPSFADAHSNLGNILRDLGNLKEAEFSTRKAIELNPNFSNAYYNLGNILRDLGKLKEAEFSTRKAIELNPNFADAQINLGIILNDLGKLKDAEISYRKALKINPKSVQGHSNLGIILKDFGDLEEAELSTREAIKLNPNYANAHLNLGNILKHLGYYQEAFDSFMRVIEINPSNQIVYQSLTEFIKISDPSQLNKFQLKKILNILLDRKNINHKDLFKAFYFLYKSELKINQSELNSDNSKIDLIIRNKLLTKALQKIIFKDELLEKQLTNIRKILCTRIVNNKYIINQYEVNFTIALAEQCFLNEYVYSLSEKENYSINQILNRCIDGEINEKNISILSCYFPLYKLLKKIPLLKLLDSSNQKFKDLIKLQILEPLKEIELSKDIKKLGTINDYISQKVKSQYEENPYPRWRYGNPADDQKFSINQAINIEIKPNSISQNIDNNKLKVLIAGCGTGNQILNSQRYKNATVTSIDLSLSSLSYAQRKVNELEIDNVQLFQLDILEISLLNERFDIIECSGVLHHMDDPQKGLKALLDVLKDNGFLKLGLYSELARKHIVAARNYIESKKLQTNEDQIRKFRETVFSGNTPEICSLTDSEDFYTLSSFRDLCFHAKEHRFTIDKLQETLESNELKFLGFLLPQQIKSLYKSYFPEDQTQTNLQNWGKFEDKNPQTFSGMYQFWSCKTKIN